MISHSLSQLHKIKPSFSAGVTTRALAGAGATSIARVGSFNQPESPSHHLGPACLRQSSENQSRWRRVTWQCSGSIRVNRMFPLALRMAGCCSGTKLLWTEKKICARKKVPSIIKTLLGPFSKENKRPVGDIIVAKVANFSIPCQVC